ncbi:hypothetical protein [Clostridium butyricum]
MAHYLNTSSHSLTELCNLSSMEQCFYLASMRINNEEQAKYDGKLAQMSNPFLKDK